MLNNPREPFITGAVDASLNVNPRVGTREFRVVRSIYTSRVQNKRWFSFDLVHN